MPSKVIAAIQAKLEQREQRGLAKYGTTLDRKDLSERDWIVHLQEELMDAVGYIEALLQRRWEAKG